MNLLRFALMASATLTAATSPYATYNNNDSLAFHMVASSIARGQGLYGSSASTSWIELGIFQQALRNCIIATNDVSQRQSWGEYLTRSLESVVTPLLNATADAGLPLDRLSIGSSFLYKSLAGIPQYDNVITTLQQSVRDQPLNANGGLWYYANPANLTYYHNLSYLDGMFSYAPFAILSVLDNDQINQGDRFGPEAVLNQLEILQNITLQPSGLLVHGYDASKAHNWSNPITGASPTVWGRSLAWYTLGIINALDVLQSPLSCKTTSRTESYAQIKRLFNSIIEPQVVAAETSYRTNGSYGVWQVVDRPGQSGNFIEASASSMTVYSLLHAAREGLVADPDLRERAVKAATGIYETVVGRFLSEAANGTLSLSGTSSVSSLAGENVGYQYYVTRPTVTNSLIGTSAFVLASLEVEHLQAAR
ncbi:Six-hairpin glycosidase [Teratosphaeria destructans]|uniref:Six-hairpin glycosidase n=1 Tax=Teratosphaeria destructans TaxID=418781 RepID=A0A9W7SLL9_9PEZI|nr:Six-hairpin glycosidase [Teratosphaeria destructans]